MPVILADAHRGCSEPAILCLHPSGSLSEVDEHACNEYRCEEEDQEASPQCDALDYRPISLLLAELAQYQRPLFTGAAG